MSNTKIIAREVAPEAIDFSFFFDDDGIKSAGGENCAVYIPETRNTTGFNADEYNDIVRQAEDIMDTFDDVGKYYKSYKEAMEDYGVKYTPKRCADLKAWARQTDTLNTDDIAEFLTITTGKRYSARSFCGYSQGDYCEVVYCEEKHSEECIELIGKVYLGCATEFYIDDCCGYYVPDFIRWDKGDKLKNYLAEMYGCNADDLEVEIYIGSHTVADYRTI